MYTKFIVVVDATFEHRIDPSERGMYDEALAANEVTVLSLTDYAAMYDVLGQAVDRLPGKVIVNLSSDSPANAREGAAWVRSRGAQFVSGGFMSAHEESTYRAPQAVFELGVPVLGICYGMQTMAAQLGGKVENGAVREFGYAEVRARSHTALLKGINDSEADARELVRKNPCPLMARSSGLLVVATSPWVNCWATVTSCVPMPTGLEPAPWSELA